MKIITKKKISVMIIMITVLTMMFGMNVYAASDLAYETGCSSIVLLSPDEPGGDLPGGNGNGGGNSGNNGGGSSGHHDDDDENTNNDNSDAETQNEVYHECPYNEDAPYTHLWQNSVIQQVTKTQNGLECEQCVFCGERRNYQEIYCDDYLMHTYAEPMVLNAQPGQYVDLQFGDINSFPKSFMEKVAVKTQENVSFGFNYNWNSVSYEIFIPAGTDINLDSDWYGPEMMGQLYVPNKLQLLAPL